MIKAAVGFCLLCALLAVCDMIMPNGKTKQMVSFAASAVFLVAVLNTVKTAVPKLSLLPQNYNLSAGTKTYEEVAVLVVGALLNDEEVYYENLSVVTNNSKEDGIIISKVTVYTNQENKEKAENVIKNKTTAKTVEVVCD